MFVYVGMCMRIHLVLSKVLEDRYCGHCHCNSPAGMIDNAEQ